MRYHPPNSRLYLDAIIAAVLMTILTLTSSFFIQALVDSVFVLGRKPALNRLSLGMLLVTVARAGFFGLRSYLVAHLNERIGGLPHAFIMDSLTVLITTTVMFCWNWELTLRSLQLIPALA